MNIYIFQPVKLVYRPFVAYAETPNKIVLDGWPSWALFPVGGGDPVCLANQFQDWSCDYIFN